MAKKTRAQRKKQTQSALKQQSAIKEELVIADAADESSCVEEQVAKAAPKAEKPAAAPVSEIKVRDEKEEKAFQKRVERAKKATAKAEKRKAKKGSSSEPRKPRFFWAIIEFFVGVKSEIKRVTWPSGNEVVKMSVVVVCALVFFGVLIFVVDSIANPLFYWFSGLGA